MRGRLITLLFMAALATTGCGRLNAGERRADLKEREEIHQNYQLTQGARVEVAGINGAVKIETTNGDTAEVNIVRYAANRAALEHNKITVNHSPDSLTVRGESKNNGVRSMLAHLFTQRSEVRQEVTLRLPRRVEVFTNGVNGRVMIGEINGAVRVSGVNGKVEVAQAVGSANVSGVNGSVLVTLAQLGDKGVSVSGVNGGVELRFANDTDASVKVSGINGSVRSTAADITVEKNGDGPNYSAQIGKGGAPVSINGVNGGVRLTRATSTEARTANPSQLTATKPDADNADDTREEE
ncbi:MAG: hypothetical protein ABR577_01400 [Pyrinomonadaceae bacterium]